MAAAIAEMERSLPAGWMRDKVAEARTQVFANSSKRITYCFKCTRDKERPAAMLVLTQRPNTFYVSNVIPGERHQLENAEYNAILEEFYAKVFKPYADSTELVHTWTGAEAGRNAGWMSKPPICCGRSRPARTREQAFHTPSTGRGGTPLSYPPTRQTVHSNLPLSAAGWLRRRAGRPKLRNSLTREYKSGLGLLAYSSGHAAGHVSMPNITAAADQLVATSSGDFCSIPASFWMSSAIKRRYSNCVAKAQELYTAVTVVPAKCSLLFRTSSMNRSS